MLEQVKIDPNNQVKAPDQLRLIKSFVRRSGRMTAAQKRGWDEKWSDWGLQCNQDSSVLAACFARKAPLVLEIGFGMGHSLVEMAQTEPEKNFIGVEIHKPGVGCLLHNADKAELTNIRVFCDDAIDVLNQAVPQDSLHRVQIYFPDPWHKKRHNKRRLVKADFISLIHSRLEPGGILHLATDWEPYAQEMLDLLSSAPGWRNQAGEKQFAPKPAFRPLTKFEKRGQNLGHSIRDLLFEKTGKE
ncbi:MAG: tRNA (guanosine(46)-N7)-methyltransferase TrmB [Endozoicomonadaceae bacterium]|nr:tRNA (guanosine(46)-N7)-methyltransferase TrmB [Endozoicomonadaceae bacterium]